MNRFEKALTLKNEMNDISTEQEKIQKFDNTNTTLNNEITLKTNSSKTVQTSIRIKSDLMKKLDAVSEKTGRSRNYLINYLIETYLEN